MFTPWKLTGSSPKNQRNLNMEKHDLTAGSPWFTYKSPNWKGKKHLPSISMFWMDLSSPEVLSLGQGGKTQMETPWWSDGGIRNGKKTEGMRRHVQCRRWRDGKNLSVEWGMILNIDKIRKEIEKSIFLHGRAVLVSKLFYFKNQQSTIKFMRHAKRVLCFLVVCEFSNPFRLAGGADSGEEYGYKSGGEVQTVAWLLFERSQKTHMVCPWFV